MKRVISLVLVVSIVLSVGITSAFADNNSAKDEIISRVVMVDQMLGMDLNEADLKALELTVDLAAEDYMDVYDISLDEAYTLILNEIESEIVFTDEPSLCSTTMVYLPAAQTGYIFYVDTDSAWNHVGMYTDVSHIVEAMPEDGVKYWPRSAAGAKQEIVTNPLDGINNSCILSVNTTSSKRASAVSWVQVNIPEDTPYDFDFLDNKRDTYMANIGTEENPIFVEISELDTVNCSELVWRGYKKGSNIDLDSNGGLGVYPNDILNSSYTVVYRGNWW